MDLRSGETKWDKDKRWSDKFLFIVRVILKRNIAHLVGITVAPVIQDTKQATDVIISISRPHVAVRIRRQGYDKFRDWTIRSSRDSGSKTELEKLREGFADWYLYIWLGTKDKVVFWVLIDLDKVRRAGILDKEMPQIHNGDGTYFVAIPLAELDSYDCIVAKTQL